MLTDKWFYILQYGSKDSLVWHSIDIRSYWLTGWICILRVYARLALVLPSCFTVVSQNPVQSPPSKRYYSRRATFTPFRRVWNACWGSSPWALALHGLLSGQPGLALLHWSWLTWKHLESDLGRVWRVEVTMQRYLIHFVWFNKFEMVHHPCHHFVGKSLGGERCPPVWGCKSFGRWMQWYNGEFLHILTNTLKVSSWRAELGPLSFEARDPRIVSRALGAIWTGIQLLHHVSV